MNLKKYVNPEYFNTQRLEKYINENEIISDDIFYSSCKLEWEKYWGLSEKYGYRKIDRNTFIKRIPFYFYFDETSKETINILFDVFPKKLDSDITEMIYKDLELIFYTACDSVSSIIKYLKRIECKKGFYDALINWANYINLCNKFGITDYMPSNFIYKYNLLLEKDGKEPIIYFFDRMNSKNYFEKDKVFLKFKGFIPVDDNGVPKYKWLGIKFLNMNLVGCNVDYFSYGELIFEITYTSLVKIFIPSVNGLVSKLVYAASKYINVSGESLLNFREGFGLSRKDVENICGINVKSLENWEKEARNPNGDDLLKLMNLYMVDDIYSLIDYKYINNYLDDTIEFGEIIKKGVFNG